MPSAACQCCTPRAPKQSLSSYSSDCSSVGAPHVWQSHLDGRAHSCVVQFPETTSGLFEGGLAAAPAEAGSGVASAQVWSVKFATQCEHHMLPFYGVMHFAVLRGGAVAPELTPECVCDLVALYSCRLQVSALQPRICYIGRPTNSRIKS